MKKRVKKKWNKKAQVENSIDKNTILKPKDFVSDKHDFTNLFLIIGIIVFTSLLGWMIFSYYSGKSGAGKSPEVNASILKNNTEGEKSNPVVPQNNTETTKNITNKTIPKISGSGSSSGGSSTTTPTPTPDTIYPQFSNFSDNNGTLVNSGIAEFNVSVANSNGTVVLNLNGTSYSASENDSNYNVSVNLTSEGTYPYFWFSYGSGSSHNYNNSQTFYYTIASFDNVYPIFSNFWDNSNSLIDSGNAIFNTTVDNTNGTVVLNIDGNKFLADNSGANLYSENLTLTSGIYNYFWYTYGNGSSNNFNQSEPRGYIVNSSDNVYPLFYNISDNNGSLFESGIANFNVTVINTNRTILLNFDGNNYPSTNISLDIYNVSINLSSARSYSYYWISFGNGTSKNQNVSSTRNYVVKPDTFYPQFSKNLSNIINGSQYNPLNNYSFNITITNTNGTAGLQFNNRNYSTTNSSNNFTVNLGNLRVGTYLYFWWSFGNGTIHKYNISQTYSYTVLINNSYSLSLNFNPVSPITYQTLDTITGSGCPAQLNCSLFVNSSSGSLSNPYSAILGAGSYNFTFNSTGNQNYSSFSISSILTVNKNTSSAVYTYLNNSRGNITIFNNSAIWLNATLINNSGTLTLYKNGTIINSGNSPLSNYTSFNSTGLFNITTIYSGNANYSGSSETWWVNVVTDTNIPLFSNMIVNPANNSNYSSGQQYKFNVTITNTNGTAGIQFNGTNYTLTNSSNNFTKTFSDLSAGNYNYYYFAFGNGSNRIYNASTNFIYVIAKATGLVNGTINRTQNNFSAINGSGNFNIYINATNVSCYGTGKIYVNGTLYNSDTLPLFNMTNLSIGYYNITFEYDGNTNFTSDRKVLWVNITAAIDNTYPQFSNFSDNNGTLIDSGIGRFNVTVTNTNSTVVLNINSQNYKATNFTSSIYNVSVNFTSGGTYPYYWFSYGNGSSHNYNQSLTRNYVVNVTNCYNGINASIITLCSCDDLNKTRNNLTANYELQNNIDFSFCNSNYITGRGWLPIGNSSRGFSGSFDGKGYKITGLYINRIDASYIGFFANNTGTLKNISLEDVNITGDQYIGGLTGINRGNILNSSVKGIINSNLSVCPWVDINNQTYVLTGKYVGGLTAENYLNGIILDSYTSVNITGCVNVGGLVGINDNTIQNSYSSGNLIAFDIIGGLVGSNTGNISFSYSSANVTAGFGIAGLPELSGQGSIAGGLVGSNPGIINNSYSTGPVRGTWFVGGLAGWNLQQTSPGIITDSYATGNVYSDKNDAGGLVGTLDSGIINNSYATGNVYGINFSGGLAGNNYGGNISNSYATGNVSGYMCVGGLIGNQSNSSIVSNSFSTGNISGNIFVGGLIGGDNGQIQNCYWNNKTTNLNCTVNSNPSGCHAIQNNVTYFYDIGNPPINSWSFPPWSGDNDQIDYPELNPGYISDCYNITNNPIKICTCDDLNKTKNNLTASYELQNDINFSLCNPVYTAGEGWVSIPTNITGEFAFPISFNGTFDGKNHTIYNLFINITIQNQLVTYDNHGLFSWSSGEIKNLKMKNSMISAHRANDGGIVGYNTGNISNCEVSDSIIIGTSYIGGITGYSEGNINNINISNVYFEGGLVGGVVGRNYGRITNSNVNLISINGASNLGAIVGGNEGNISNWSISSINITGGNYVGGYAGYSNEVLNNINLNGVYIDGGYYVGGIIGISTKNITNCSVSGIIKGDYYVGGLVGYFGNNTASSNSLNIAIKNSTANINITASMYVGGLVGYNRETIINSSSTGDISATNYVGGLVGYSDTSGNINNSYSIINISGNLGVGGLVGENHGKITKSYSKYKIFATLNYIGGFVGLNNGTIDTSYSTGILTSTGTTSVGGFTGKNTGNLTNCYSKTNITFNNDHSGGLVGSNNGTIDYCYSTGNVTAYGYAGGLVGSNYEEGYIKNSFSTANVTISAGTFPFNWTLVNDTYVKVCWGEICFQGNLVGRNYAQTDDHIQNSYAYNRSIYPECIGWGFTGGCNQKSNITYFYNITNPPMDTWSFPPWSNINNGIDYPVLQ